MNDEEFATSREKNNPTNTIVVKGDDDTRSSDLLHIIDCKFEKREQFRYIFVVINKIFVSFWLVVTLKTTSAMEVKDLFLQVKIKAKQSLI